MSERSTPAGPTGRARPTWFLDGLANFFVVGLGRGLAEVLLALRGFVIAGLVGPELFGIWAAFRLAMQYAAIADTGVLRGVEIQVARASGSMPANEPASTWGRAALGYILVVVGLLSLVAALGAVLAGQSSIGLVCAGLAMGLLANRVWMYGITYLRAGGNLRRSQAMLVAHAALQLALTGMLAAIWGLAGAMVGSALAGLAGVVLLLRAVPFRPSLSLARVRALLRTGFPLGLALMLTTGLVTVDQIMVGALGGATQLGHYALAVSLAGLGGSVASVVWTVIFPDLYRQSRVEGVAPTVRAHLATTLLPFVRLLSPLLGLLALGFGPLVILALPHYEPALPALRIFIFTGVTAGVVMLGSLGVAAAGEQRQLPMLTAVAGALSVGLSSLALVYGFGIEGVAAGALISRCALSGAILLMLAAAAELELRAKLLLEFLFPIGWCALAVAVIGHLFPGADLRSVGLSFGLYLLALAPVVPGAVSDLRRLWRAARAAPSAQPSRVDLPPPGQ